MSRQVVYSSVVMALFLTSCLRAQQRSQWPTNRVLFFLYASYHEQLRLCTYHKLSMGLQLLKNVRDAPAATPSDLCTLVPDSPFFFMEAEGFVCIPSLFGQHGYVWTCRHSAACSLLKRCVWQWKLMRTRLCGERFDMPAFLSRDTQRLRTLELVRQMCRPHMDLVQKVIHAEAYPHAQVSDCVKHALRVCRSWMQRFDVDISFRMLFFARRVTLSSREKRVMRKAMSSSLARDERARA